MSSQLLGRHLQRPRLEAGRVEEGRGVGGGVQLGSVGWVVGVAVADLLYDDLLRSLHPSS